IQGFIQGWKQRKTNDFLLFSFLISTVFILFFSISSTKLPNYPMPSYPFIVVLIAVYLNEIIKKSISLKGYKISLWVLLVITVLMPVVAYIALSEIETQSHGVRSSYSTLTILPCSSIATIAYFYRGRLKECRIVIGIGDMSLSLELFQCVYASLV